MKHIFLSVSVSLLSAMAVAQPMPGQRETGTEAGAYCEPCRQRENNLKAVQDAINGDGVIAGLKTRKAVQQVVREEIAKEEMEERQQAALNAEKKKYSVVFDDATAFTEQNIDEVARKMKVQGWQIQNPIHVYFLTEVDRAQQDRARAMLTKALKKTLEPQTKQMQDYAKDQWKVIRTKFSKSGSSGQEADGNQSAGSLEELPKRTVLASEYYAEKAKAAAAVAAAGDDDPADSIPGANPKKRSSVGTNVADSLVSTVWANVNSVDLGGRKIKVQVYSSESPEAKQYLGVVGGYRTGLIEARASKKINSSMQAGVSVSIGQRDGIKERAIYLFISGELDAFFQPVRN